MEQKTLHHDDLQLAHHLINELFRMLGTMNPWLYQTQCAISIPFGAHPGLWQGMYSAPYGQPPGMIPVRAGSQRVIPLGQGFIF